jgi:hypothetical protein
MRAVAVTRRSCAAAIVPVGVTRRGADVARWNGEKAMIHEYAAIDPMALLFPSRLYIELSEKLHPHVPKSIEIKEALGRLTPEERKYILVRARMLSTYSKAVEEAVGSMK